MSDFIFGVNLVLPLFIVILVGFVLRRKDVFNDTTVNSITTLVYYVAMPAKLFSDTISVDFTQVFDVQFVLFAIIGSFVSFILLFILVPIFVKDNKKVSAMIHAGFRGNFVFIGIPLVENILGKSPVASTSLIIVFVLPMYTILAVFVLTYFGNKEKGFKLSNLLMDILTNPLVLSILLAIPFSFLKIEFPSFINSTLDILGRLSTPLALLLIGAGLRLNTFEGESAKIFSVAIFKTVVQPLILVPLALSRAFSVDIIVTIFVLFSVPCASNVYIMTKKMGGDADLASSITVVSLIITMITLPLGISILGKLGII